MMCQSPP